MDEYVVQLTLKVKQVETRLFEVEDGKVKSLPVFHFVEPRKETLPYEKPGNLPNTMER